MNFSHNPPLFRPYFHIIRKLLYRPEKVDTEKIFQLNNFSKVDNSDIFV